MFKGKNLPILLVGILLGAFVVGGMFYLGRRTQSTPTNGKVTITPEPTPTPTIPNQQTGIIEGSLGFPSEGIPEDIMACAETLQGEVVACTDTQIQDTKFTYGVGYSLNIAPGTYFVYATAPSFDPDYKAYYSEFVTCGLSVECTSHEPVPVEVSAGETVTGIDPQDWYNQ